MLKIEIDREVDGRWIAEVRSLPGVLVYGATEDEARTNVTALAFRVIADRIEHGESVPDDPQFEPAWRAWLSVEHGGYSVPLLCCASAGQ